MLTRDALRLALAGAMAVGCTGYVDEVITPMLPAADDIVMGNRSCAEVAARAGADFGDFELVVEPGTSGTYRLDPLNEVTLVSEDGFHLDWSATTAMDAVLVRGGDGTAVYAPGPELAEGQGLTAPMNPKLEEPYAIRGVVFCYDHELAVTTALSTAMTRTHQWTIANTAAQPQVTLAKGELSWMWFTAEVARAGATDGDWSVRGAMAITNPAPYPATIVGVEAWLGKLPARVTCDGWLPVRLEPGATTTCRYARTFDSRHDGPAHVIVRTAGYEVGVGVAETTIDFSRASIKERDTMVEVWDQYARLLGTAGSAGARFVHPLLLGPYASCGPAQFHDTAAAIGVDTGTTVRATADVKVEVTCGE